MPANRVLPMTNLIHPLFNRLVRNLLRLQPRKISSKANNKRKQALEIK